MRARIAELVRALRRADVAVSVAEAMDAARAAALVGVERFALRDALAAALVKDERERPVFLAAFDAVFPSSARAVSPERHRGRPRRAAAAAGEGGGAGTGDGEARAPSSRAPARPSARGAPRDEATARQFGAHDVRDTAEDDGRDTDDARDAAAVGAAPDGRETLHEEGRAVGERAASDAADARHADAARSERGASGREMVDADHEHGGALARLGRERRLLVLPFRTMTPRDVDACAALARAIAARVTARVRRRLASGPSGRLDFRRTIRAAVPRGGVPFERRYRARRPGRPDLVALCDLSVSTATATDFFLALLAPATVHFRRVRLFGFVDRLVEIEFEGGHVRPAAPIDLMARSDFGRVLRDLVEAHDAALGADTVLLVLGDARNNRRPARADLLATARTRVRRVLWLNPEPRDRWNTGDSVIATYARHADAIVECGNLKELERALIAVAKL